MVSFPVPLPGQESPCVRRPGDSVVTVGRYVDFKTCTIFAMIDVVEKLNDEGRKLDYHIYGEGPSETALRTRTEGSRWRERLHLHGALAQEHYRCAMLEHTVFFGMGSAIFQAGVAGIPGIIAIQGEATVSCYGLLVDHDHGANPVFGDPTPGLRVLPLERTLTRVLDLDPEQWKSLAEESRRVAKPYTGPQLLTGIREAVAGAKWISGARVSVLDLVRIRLETYYARFLRKPGIHV